MSALHYYYVSYGKFSFRLSKIRLGEHNTLTNPDCEKGHCAEPVQDFLPEMIIVHNSFNKPRNMHDIALIRLNSPVTYNGEYMLTRNSIEILNT